VGEPDEAEDLLKKGWDIFPDAYHLPVQLAILLADQGRHPEALETLDTLPNGAPVPDELQVFLLGLHANLLASVGRWGEADGVLREGRYRHPESDLLEDAHRSLGEAWARFRAQEALAESWLEGLTGLEGVAGEVDAAVMQLGSLADMQKLVIIAARRLWRAYLEHHAPRLHIPEPWAVALLVAVGDLDDHRPSVSAMARQTRCSPSTARSALRRIRGFLDGLDRDLAKRAFAAVNNPRLDENLAPTTRDETGSVIPFPSR
jgi:hypothetical protein